MKKFVITLICLFGIGFFFLPVLANEKVLTGGVVYTVETAKNAAFDGLALSIDKTFLESYLKDENNKENREALKTGKQLNDRQVMKFSVLKDFVKGYAVVYDNKPDYVFYYTTGGYLVAVDVNTQAEPETYPIKVGKYNPLTGNLISIGLYISDDEQYVYMKNGKLKAHWIGDTAYNEKGKIIAKREY